MFNTVSKKILVCVTVTIFAVVFSGEAFAWRIVSDYSSQFDNYGNTLPSRGIVMSDYITGKIDVSQVQRNDDSKIVVRVKLVQVSPRGQEVPRKNAGKLMVWYYEGEIPTGVLRMPDKVFTVKHGEDVELTVPDNISFICLTLRLAELPDKNLAYLKLAR